jgi:hypothetical protein
MFENEAAGGAKIFVNRHIFSPMIDVPDNGLLVS